MDKDEVLRLALEALGWTDEWRPQGLKEEAITAIKAALEAKDEPVKVAHRHEWFRTGEMKVGQMRCISCGTWAEEEMPHRTWVGLTADEMLEALRSVDAATAVNLLMSQYKMPPTFKVYAEAIEAKLKEKNT
jgi:hypothetical protein